MTKKLYVGNLSYQMTEDGLRDIFAPMGEVVSAKVITDAATGRSKGFGFVEMASDEDADKAISSLNGTSVMERAINVSEAQAADRPRAGPERTASADLTGAAEEGNRIIGDKSRREHRKGFARPEAQDADGRPLRELKNRRFYEKPSLRKKRKQREAQKRKLKSLRMRRTG